MLESPYCPICGGVARLYGGGNTDADSFFLHPENYIIAGGAGKATLDVYQCAVCGHGFTPLTVGEQVVHAWYQQAPPDRSFLAESSARQRTADRVLSRLHHLTGKPGYLLDVGAGPGLFLQTARERGWQIAGVEPSAWARQWAGEHLGDGIILEGDVAALEQVAPESFDVVTAFDVVEHVVHPREFIERCARVLRPGGMLVLTTPKFDSFLARFMGKKWYCIFPAHIHYFSFASLARILNENGLQVMQRRSHVRYLSLAYFWRRLLDYIHLQPSSGQHASSRIVLPINFADEFEIYARKQ